MSKPVFSEYGRALAHWKIGATWKPAGRSKTRAGDHAMALVEPGRSPLAVLNWLLRCDRDAVAAVGSGRLAAPGPRTGQHVAERDHAAPRAGPCSVVVQRVEPRFVSRGEHVDLLEPVGAGSPAAHERRVEVPRVHAARAARMSRRRARVRRVADALDARVDDLEARLVACRACARSRWRASSRCRALCWKPRETFCT